MKVSKTIFIVLVLFACFSGCKSIKKTEKTKYKADYIAQNSAKLKFADNSVFKTLENIEDKSILNENTEVEKTVFVISVPDSCSRKQYVKQIIKTTLKANNSKQNNIKKNTIEAEQKNVVTDLKKHSEIKDKSVLKTDVKTVLKKKTPLWVTLSILFIVVIACVGMGIYVKKLIL